MPIIKVSDEAVEVMAAAMQNGIIASLEPAVFDALPNDKYKVGYAKAALFLNEYPREQLLKIFEDLKKQCCGDIK